jgi:hypothetical protein
MKELPFSLTINNVDGIYSVDRSKSQPNSNSSMVAGPLDPKVPTHSHFAHDLMEH